MALRVLGQWGFRVWGIEMPRYKGSRALDVGCGEGFYVRALRDLGWRAWGVEMSPMRAARARDVSAAVVIVDAHQLPFAPGTFDAIFFWHVLEHLKSPRVALHQARALLRTDGVVVVEVPNWHSLQARLFGERWLHLAHDVHYWHFSASHLRLLLEQAGFARVRVWSVPNAVGWTDSAGIARRWTQCFAMLESTLALLGEAGALRGMAVAV